MTGTHVVDQAPPLRPGTPAPEFELRSTPSQTVKLSEFRGRAVILAFYPNDWSPVCSDQLSLYNELLPEFQRLGAELFGSRSTAPGVTWPSPTTGSCASPVRGLRTKGRGRAALRRLPPA